MATLAENVQNWLGRVELLARGADDERRAALAALERGDPLEARDRAHALLAKAPGSPLGLALLVDACEQAWLYEEAVDALRHLCESAPWRAELWVRLAALLQQLGAAPDEVGGVLEHALEPDVDACTRRAALLQLTDIDLREGDPWRAGRWLEALRMVGALPDVALRRLELGLIYGDRELVQEAAEAYGEPEPMDGRGTLACGRARWLLGELGALDLLLRAYIVEEPGAAQALASFVASSRDAVEVARVRAVLASAGTLQEPSFALALALAEGREADAHDALAKIARAGDRAAARSLYDIAIERVDFEALRVAMQTLGDSAPPEGGSILQGHEAIQAGRGADALRVLDRLTSGHGPTTKLAHRMRTQVFGAELAQGRERFREILIELRRAAASLDRLDLAAQCEVLAVEDQRPLRVAVVGEFNAGKSTFVNALLGADVAPTGILPTTASLHWLSWAPDPFARVVTHEGEDRIVGHEGLKAALRELQQERRAVREVHICAPIERLRRIEVLDTPGFNAPNADHIAAAQRAVHEAHVALWILDGTQALKDSERRVLARIADLGTPVQVLVNKADRLPSEELDRVMQHVQRGVDDIGLPTMGAVLAFSARLALAGRLGDVQAAAQSGWEALEERLATLIVNRSDELRSAAVRRKARAVAVDLDELARRRTTQVQAGESTDGVAPPVAAGVGARLGTLGPAACDRIARALRPAAQSLADDLRPLRVASMRDDDPQGSAYAEARVLARLTAPIIDGLRREVGADAELAALVRAPVAWVLRGASATMGVSAPQEVASWRVVRACALAVHERLASLRLDAEQSQREEPQWARLRALRAAFDEALPAAPVSGSVER